MIKIKNLITVAVLAATAMSLGSCSQQDIETFKSKINQKLNGNGGDAVQVADENLPNQTEVVNKIRQSDRIYVTEYAVQKIVTADDVRKINVGKTKIPISIGDRKIAIPIEAILKAYIDFDSLKSDDIIISKEPRKLSIKLKSPKVEMTSSKINHKDIKEFASILRSSFSDKEMTYFENQGRDAILASIPTLGIGGRAEKNAREVLIPMFMQFGFDSKEIEIEFKK